MILLLYPYIMYYLVLSYNIRKLTDRSWERLEGSLFKSFSSRRMGGPYSFSMIAPLTLDPYLILLRVKLDGIKYHFLMERGSSLFYTSVAIEKEAFETPSTTVGQLTTYLRTDVLRSSEHIEQIKLILLTISAKLLENIYRCIFAPIL